MVLIFPFNKRTQFNKMYLYSYISEEDLNEAQWNVNKNLNI